jgi:hypothetical protein
MKVKYNREVDILLLWLSDDPFDYAEESEGVITHYSADGRPVLLEIQGAREFLLGSLTNLVKGGEVKLPKIHRVPEQAGSQQYQGRTGE